MEHRHKAITKSARQVDHPSVVHPNDLIEEKFHRFNDKVIETSAKTLGSSYFFYFCVLLDIAELPPVIQASSIIIWINYIAQTVIQLVALPLLQSYQNKQQVQSDAKAEADHRNIVHIVRHQDEISDKVDTILAIVSEKK